MNLFLLLKRLNCKYVRRDLEWLLSGGSSYLIWWCELLLWILYGGGVVCVVLIKTICFCSVNCNSISVFYLTVLMKSSQWSVWSYVFWLSSQWTQSKESQMSQKGESEHCRRKPYKALSLTPCWESWKPPSGFYQERKINVNSSNLNTGHL